MPPPNFMLRDVLGSTVAVFAFVLVLFAPGYLFGFASNVLGYRRMPFAQQSRWAVAFSFCMSPIAADLLGRAFHLGGVCWALAATGLAGATLLLLRRSSLRLQRREFQTAAAIIAAWTALVFLLLIDFQVGHKLFYSVVMADQSYRIAFTDAVMRTGVPPANPLYFAGTAASMHYYYFWYVLCAAVAKIAHVSARQSFIASSVWAGLGLLVAVHLYASEFFRWTRKTTWIATGLLLVTGADLLPALGNLVLQSSINGSSEWWSVDPIDAWPDSLLWVPHHVASVLCCLFAFLLLWRALRLGSWAQRAVPVCLAACACASAFGLSVYVAVGFAILMAAWLTRAFLSRDLLRRSWLRMLVFVAVFSGVLLTPFLLELMGSGNDIAQSSSTPKHLLQFSLRPMIDSGLITSLPQFASWNRAHPALFDQSVRLLLLLPGLALELGLYGVVLVLLVKDRLRKQLPPQTEEQKAALFLCVTGLLMTLFVSSSVISNNDFGYRAVMLPHFFLTLLTADVIGSWRSSAESPVLQRTPLRQALVTALLVLGIAGSVYWAVLLRAWLPIESAKNDGRFASSPQDAFQVRDAFEQLQQSSPQHAVVAFRDMDLNIERKDMEVMTPTEFFQRMLVMDAGMQILNAEPKCATHFGGDPRACSKMKERTAELYASPSPSSLRALQYCREMGVQYMVLSARDPGWMDTAGWTTELPVAAREPRLKILRCGIPW